MNSMQQCHFWEANSRLAGQQFPIFNGTQWFITVFTKARHWYLLSARQRQSTLSDTVFKIHFNIISLPYPSLPKMSSVNINTKYEAFLNTTTATIRRNSTLKMEIGHSHFQDGMYVYRLTHLSILHLICPYVSSLRETILMNDVALQAFKCKWIICIPVTKSFISCVPLSQLRPFFSLSLLHRKERLPPFCSASAIPNTVLSVDNTGKCP